MFKNKNSNKNINKSPNENIDAAIHLYGEKIKTGMKGLIKFKTDLQPHKSKEFLEIIKSLYPVTNFENYQLESDIRENFMLSISNVIIKINFFEICFPILYNLLQNIFGKGYCNEIDENLEFSIHFIMDLIHNYTDHCSEFSKEFCQYDELLKLYRRIINEFKESCLLETISESLESILNGCIITLYNSLLHDIPEILIKMREMNFLEDIKDLLKCENTYIKTSALLFTTFVADENEMNLFKGDLKSFYYFIEILKKSINNYPERSEGFSREELLKGLKQLSKNDDNKRLLVEKGILPIIKDILVKDDVKLISSALSVLWNLAFDDKNKVLIKKEFPSLFSELKARFNTPCDITIDSRCTLQPDQLLPNKKHSHKNRKLKNSDIKVKDLDKQTTMNARIYMDDYDKAKQICKNTLNGLLWTLSVNNEEFERANNQAAEIKKEIEKKPIKSHIMISYNRSDSDIALKIYDRLVWNNYNVWIDEHNMVETENLMESMAQAVQNSTAVIICVSHKYKNSKNCRAEAQYAESQKKSLIPIMVQEKYRPDGWLGFCITGIYYCDFAGKYDFEYAFGMLIKQIDSINNSNNGDMEMKKVEIDELDRIDSVKVNNLLTNPSKNFYLHEWSNENVKEWFQNIGIERIVWKEHYSGKELDFIRNMSKVPGEFFYQICKTDLEITDLRDLRILVENLQLL